jgi:hypothetical protein
MRSKWLRGGLITAASATSVLLFTCAQQREERYATYNDAVEQGAVRRGWIPAYVPRNATNIAEVHDLDTNGQLLRFQAPPEGLTAMAARLTPVLSRDVPPPPRYLSPPGAGRWRRDLGSGTLPEGLTAYRVHLDSGSAHCIALDMHGLTVFAWTCGD